MNQDMRDLAHAGLYLLAATSLVIGGYTGAAYAVKHNHIAPVVAAALHALDTTTTPTRLSSQIESAREVRAALARPIPPPPKLPPITAKLAYGYLKPGGKDHMMAVASAAPKRVPKIPNEALDAMAMQPPPVQASMGFSRQTYAPPDKHRVVY
jgi:hypothetical protein